LNTLLKREAISLAKYHHSVEFEEGQSAHSESNFP